MKNNFNKEFNVILVRLGSLGDILVTVPSINLIRENLPHSNITLIANQTYGHFLKEAGLVDQLIPLESSQALAIFDREKEMAEPDFRKADLLIIWLNRAFSGSKEIIPEILKEKAQLIFGENEKNFSISKNFLIKTGEVLEIIVKKKLQIVCEEKYTTLPIKREWLKEAESLFPKLLRQKFVVVHPGSGGEKKRWGLENFLALVNFFANHKLAGIIITGPAEESYLPILSSYRWPGNWYWSHEPSLRVIAALLFCASFYVGNDSGITHLAALCGCPGLAFYKRENVSIWAPYSKKIKILEASDLKEIEAEFVCWKIRKILAMS